MTSLGRFGPPVVLMGLIFLVSAQPDLNSGLGVIDLVGRKVVHMGEYGLLFLAWLRALGWRAPLAAAGIAVAYAATDELHQHFVPGRHGAPLDVVIDATGVLLTAYVWRARRRRPG